MNLSERGDQDPDPGSRARSGGPVPPGSHHQRHVTRAEVAKLAGVSSQTVSRVAHGHPSVISSTRERVLTAMQELGYRPNSAARALRYGRFKTIGVILHSFSAIGHSTTVEAIA